MGGGGFALLFFFLLIEPPHSQIYQTTMSHILSYTLDFVPQPDHTLPSLYLISTSLYSGELKMLPRSRFLSKQAVNYVRYETTQVSITRKSLSHILVGNVLMHQLRQL